MEKQRNYKRYLIIWLVFLGFFLLIGWKLGASMHEGLGLRSWGDSVTAWAKTLPAGLIPHADEFNGRYTALGLILMFMVWAFMVAVGMWNWGNYMPGKEYGSAKWEDPKNLTKKYADKKAENILKGIKHPFNTHNRIVSQNLRVSLESALSNNHTLVIGGSGRRKSTGYVLANLLSLLDCSSITTDPKGECLRMAGPVQRAFGHTVKALMLRNAKDLKKSAHYNPFIYIESEEDCVELAEIFMKSTESQKQSSADPYWVEAAGYLLQSFFLYVWKYSEKKTMRSVCDLLNDLKIEDDPNTGGRKISPTEKKFHELPDQKDSCVTAFDKAVQGPTDTINSVVAVLNSRMKYLNMDSTLEIFDDDDIAIHELGCGVDFDGKTITDLYLVINDQITVNPYKFIVSMLYMQLTKVLYRYADTYYGGKLPISVQYMMDEWANVETGAGFVNDLTTMRSRGMFVSVILQSLTQAKTKLKDEWETLMGNCATIIYLGGNEPTTNKYFSEDILGEQTIDKKSSGESLGSHGSTSHNYDRLGRKLRTPAEVRKLSKKKCLVILEGEDPVIDYKYNLFSHPLIGYSGYKQKPYDYDASKERNLEMSNFKLLNDASLKAYSGIATEQGKDIVYTIDVNDLLALTPEQVSKFNKELPNLYDDEILQENRERIQTLIKKKKETTVDISSLTKEQTITIIKLKHDDYSPKLINALFPLVENNWSFEKISELFNSSFDADEATEYVANLV